MLTCSNTWASKPYSISVVTSGLSLGFPRYPRTMYGTLTPLIGPIDALKYGMAAVAPGCTPAFPHDVRRRSELTRRLFGKNDSSDVTQETPRFGYTTVPCWKPKALFLSVRA